MKKYMWIFFAVLMFFISFYEVDARINKTNSEIECVYANGVVIGMNYDKVSKQNLIYVRNYPVSNSVEIDFETITNVSIYDENGAVNALSGLTCPESVYYWIAGEPTNNSNYSYRGVYNFSIKSGNSNNEDEDITSALIAPQKTGWFIFSSIKTSGKVIPVRFKSDYCSNSTSCSDSNCAAQYNIKTSCDMNGVCSGSVENSDNKKACSPEAKIPLVTERIYFVDDIGEDAYGHTYKLVNNDEQAISVNKYAQIYKGPNGTGGTQYFLQVGKNVTSINDGYFDNTYICIKQSDTTQDSNRGESAYKFSSIRHDITKKSEDEITCGEGEQLYIKTTSTCKIEVSDNKDSFCDKYSNTAFVLIDIIKIMQVLVPAVVIVFTGIEIGRIVLAGNIEEELPKRKKNILVRLIVMIAFFFLPTIVQLVISLAEGVSILDVSCLFNDGKKVEQNNELTEKECVEANESTSGDSNSSGGFPDYGVNDNVQTEIK